MDRNHIRDATAALPSVALRKESVDRNLWWGVRKAVGSLSLSARRAWIEIALLVNGGGLSNCRSPQGERG